MAVARSFSRGTALLVAGAFFMENLDGTIIQTAAPVMASHFGVEATDLNLAMVAYLMTVAVIIPATGWLASRFGTRRTFTVAVVLFTVASALCALAPSLLVLNLARVLQGVGGALMVPVGRLVILRGAAKTDLLAAFGYLTWPGLVAPVVAPLVGGALAQSVGWEWIFLINVPLGVAALAAGHWLLPRAEDTERTRFDWAGFGVLAVGLGCVTAGGELLGNLLLGLGVLAAGVVLCCWAVWFMRRSAAPLLHFSALRRATFRVGNVSGSVYRLLISALPFLFTLWLQVGLGYSPVSAGAVVIAVFLGNVAIKPLTTPIIRFLGFKATLVWSNLLGLAVIAVFAWLGAWTPVWLVVGLLFVSGVLRSIGFSAYNTVQFVDVDQAGMNDANTLSSTLQQVATALGIATVALAVRVGDAVGPGLHVDAFTVAFLIAAAVMLVPLVGSLLLPRGSGSEATTRS